MVDEYRTDEEQIEAIKNWWQENGRSTVITVVLAIGGVFGWQQWQKSEQGAQESAAAQYQELLDAVGQTEQTASLVATASHLAGELKENHSSSAYAHFAALHMAKLQVEDNSLSEARAQLQWILDNRAPDPAIASLARLRLARVVFAESGAQEALSVLDNVEAGVYQAAYAELRGDLYHDLGDLDNAEHQYAVAREGADSSTGNQNALLEMKYKSVVRERAVGTASQPLESVDDAVEAAAEEQTQATANSEALGVDPGSATSNEPEEGE